MDRVVPAGNDGGVWNQTGNMPAGNIRRKRGRAMREERNIECMNLRSQRNQMIQTLEAELRQKDKHLHLMAEVAVVMSAVAGIATGALLVLH